LSNNFGEELIIKSRDFRIYGQNFIFFTFLLTLLIFSPLSAQGEEIIKQSHPQRPDWTFAPSIPGEEHPFRYFVGISTYRTSEQESRREAINDARNKIAKYIGVRIRISGSLEKNIIRQEANSFVSQYLPKDWFIKKVRRGKDIEWKSFVLMAIPAELLKKEINRTEKNVDVVRQLDRKITLFVRDFETEDNRQGRNIKELLENTLSEDNQIQLVDRTRLNQVLEEKGLQQAGILSPENISRVGRILGADMYFIFGFFSYLEFFLQARNL